MDFKNSQTYQNLLKAFAGECEAYTKYELYAKKAKKQGFNQISDIFNETAANEFEHAKLFFKKIHNGDIPVTVDNLIDCISGENYENKTLYRDFANVARTEGYDEISRLFDMIADIEGNHLNRFDDVKKQLENNELFKSSNDKTVWICQNCGHVHIGKDAPEVCPVCYHPKGYFYKQ